MPGGLQAYKGLSSLVFNACVLRGSKIKLNPEKIGTFASAGLAISEEVARLKHKHEEKYEDKLVRVVELTSASPGASPAPPHGGLLALTDEPPELTGEESAGPPLVEFESLDALKGLTNITVEVKAAVKG